MFVVIFTTVCDCHDDQQQTNMRPRLFTTKAKADAYIKLRLLNHYTCYLQDFYVSEIETKKEFDIMNSDVMAYWEKERGEYVDRLIYFKIYDCSDIDNAVVDWIIE